MWRHAHNSAARLFRYLFISRPCFLWPQVEGGGVFRGRIILPQPPILFYFFGLDRRQTPRAGQGWAPAVWSAEEVEWCSVDAVGFLPRLITCPKCFATAVWLTVHAAPPPHLLSRLTQPLQLPLLWRLTAREMGGESESSGECRRGEALNWWRRIEVAAG